MRTHQRNATGGRNRHEMTSDRQDQASCLRSDAIASNVRERLAPLRLYRGDRDWNAGDLSNGSRHGDDDVEGAKNVLLLHPASPLLREE